MLNDFDAFLLDHAACERKASATALSLMAHYPDKRELVHAMMAIAREELEHFDQVYQLIDARGGQLAADRKDSYVQQLTRHVRNGREHYLLDRLLVASVIEARGCERFALIGEHHPDTALKTYYADLAKSEARHAGAFLSLARRYFPEEQVHTRLNALLEAEAHIMINLPTHAALH